MNLSHYFRCFLTLLSPEINTKVCYRLKFHKNLDLNNPVTLNEKILKLKLENYGSNELVRQCADKFRVREYIKEKDCNEILVPLLASYDKVEQIQWDSLPDSFVIKWNFGCGYNILCPNKRALDITATEKQLKKWGRRRAYLPYSEMQYKGVPKKLIVEEFLSDGTGELPSDYKVYCFHGKPHCVMLCTDRESGHAKYYFFDREWNLLRINKAGVNAPPGFTVPKPEGIDKVFDYAEKLSNPFKFVRADFYLVKGKVYFGELTFTPGGGMDFNRLPETDIQFGHMLHL